MKSTKFKLNLEKNDEKLVFKHTHTLEEILARLDTGEANKKIKFSDEEIKRFEDNLKDVKIANSYDDNIIYEDWLIEEQSIQK